MELGAGATTSHWTPTHSFVLTRLLCAIQYALQVVRVTASKEASTSADEDVHFLDACSAHVNAPAMFRQGTRRGNITITGASAFKHNTPRRRTAWRHERASASKTHPCNRLVGPRSKTRCLRIHHHRCTPQANQCSPPAHLLQLSTE